MEIEVGERLRVERRRKQLSLRELGGRVGISASMLSQLETGRSRASVRTLYSLARELDLSLDELFTGRKAVAPEDAGLRRDRPVIRRGERRAIELDSGVVWERLADITPERAQFLEITYRPGSSSAGSGRYQQHSGFDFGYLLTGELTVHLSFDTYVLRPGDTIMFDASEPHMLENTGTDDARAVWVVVR